MLAAFNYTVSMHYTVRFTCRTPTVPHAVSHPASGADHNLNCSTETVARKRFLCRPFRSGQPHGA